MNNHDWISAWTSTIGLSHISENLPCQDSSRISKIPNTDFIVAAVADGAGSCSHSDIGSSFVVETAINKFTNLCLHLNSKHIDYNVWRIDAFAIFKEIKTELQLKAYDLSIDFTSLSSTLIVAVSDGNFIACANVGDGRACYRDLQANWHPLMTPTKGEEANQTLFLTSRNWDDQLNSEYFGSFIHCESISAFSLMTDGCERAAFEISKYDEETETYYDPNKPYKPFFEHNYNVLIQLHRAGKDQNSINMLWNNFIKSGNEKLSKETDDKTMSLSVITPTLGI